MDSKLYRNFQKRYPVYAEGGAATGAGGRGVRGRFDQQEVEMQENHTLGTFVMDAGKFALNQALTPIETVTGRNFYDPEFNYGGWDKADNVSSGVSSAATDIAGTYFGGPFYTMGKKATQQTVNTLDPNNKLDNTNAQVSANGGEIHSDKGQDATTDPTFKYWFMKNSRRKDVMEAAGDLEKLKELFFADSKMKEFPVFSGDIDNSGNIDKKQRSIDLNEAILGKDEYNDGTTVTTNASTVAGNNGGQFDLQSLLAKIQGSGGNIDINSLLQNSNLGGGGTDGGGQFMNMFSGMSNPSAGAGSTANSTGFGNTLGNLGGMFGGENAGAWSSGLNTLGSAMTTPTVGDQFGVDRGTNREWTGLDGGLINTWKTDTPQMIAAQKQHLENQRKQAEIAAQPVDYYSQDGANQFGQTGTTNYMNNAYFRGAQNDWVKNDVFGKINTTIAKVGNLASNFVGGGGAPGGSGAGMFQGGSFLGAGGGGGISGGGGGGMDFSSMLSSLQGGGGEGGMDFAALMKNFNMANQNTPVQKHGGSVSKRIAGNSRRYNMGTEVSNNDRAVDINTNPSLLSKDELNTQTYGSSLNWDGNLLTIPENFVGYTPIDVGKSHEQGGTLMSVPAEGQGNTIIEAEKNEGIEVNEHGDSYIYSTNKPNGSKWTFKERKDKREKQAVDIQNELEDKGETIDPYRKHTLMRLLMTLESEEWADRSEQDEIKKKNELKERIELEGLLSGNQIAKHGSYVKKGKRKKLTAYQQSIYPEMARGGYAKYEDGDDVKQPDFDVDKELQHLWDEGHFDLVNEIRDGLDAGMTHDRESFNRTVIEKYPKAIKDVTQQTDESLRAGIENGDLNFKDYKNHNPEGSRQDFKDFKKDRTVNKPERSDKKELYKDHKEANKEHKKNKPKKPSKPTANSTKYKWGTDGSGGWKSGGKEAYEADLAAHADKVTQYETDMGAWNTKNDELNAQKTELDNQWDATNEEYDIAEKERKGDYSKVRPNKDDYKIDNPNYDPDKPEGFNNRKQIIDKDKFNTDLDAWKTDKKTFNSNKKQDKRAQNRVDKGKEPNPKHYRTQEEYNNALKAYNENNEEVVDDKKKNEKIDNENNKNNQNNSSSSSSSTQSWDGRGPGDYLGDLGLAYGSTAGIGNTKEFWDEYQKFPNENFYRKHQVGDRAETILENKGDLIEAGRKNTERTLREDLNKQYSLNRDSASSFGNRNARDQNAYNTYAGNKIDSDIKYGLMRMGEQDKLADQYWDTDKLTVAADFDVRQADQEDLAGYYTQLGIDKQNIAKNLQELGKNRNQGFLNSQLHNSLQGNQYSPGKDGGIYFNHEGCTGPGCTHPSHTTNNTCPGGDCPGCGAHDCVNKDNNKKEGTPCSQEQIDACVAPMILDSNCNCVEPNNTNNDKKNNETVDKCADLGPCEQQGWVRTLPDCECIDPNAEVINKGNNTDNNTNTDGNTFAHTYNSGQRDFSGSYEPGSVGHFQEWNSIFNDPTGRLLSQTGSPTGGHYGTDGEWKGVDNNPGGKGQYESGLYKTNTRRLGNTHGNEYYNWMINEGLMEDGWEGKLTGVNSEGGANYMQLDNTRNETTFNKREQVDFNTWKQTPGNENKTIDDFKSDYNLKSDGGMVKNLKSMGRFGDTELAHVNPQEKSLLEAMGGSGTTNPQTGLKEYWVQAAMQLAPMVMSMLGNKKEDGGSIASKGRYGDTELAHVNKYEKQILEELGGSGTINPETGLKEYWVQFIPMALSAVSALSSMNKGKDDKEEGGGGGGGLSSMLGGLGGMMGGGGSGGGGLMDMLGGLGGSMGGAGGAMAHGGRVPNQYGFGSNITANQPNPFDSMPQFSDGVELKQQNNEKDFIQLRQDQATDEVDANSLTLIPGLDGTNIDLRAQARDGGMIRHNLISRRRTESDKRIGELREWLNNRNK